MRDHALTCADKNQASQGVRQGAHWYDPGIIACCYGCHWQVDWCAVQDERGKIFLTPSRQALHDARQHTPQIEQSTLHRGGHRGNGDQDRPCCRKEEARGSWWERSLAHSPSEDAHVPSAHSAGVRLGNN